MKTLLALAPVLLISRVLAAEPGAHLSGVPAQKTHRYLIERTFPAGALDGLDAATKAKVNANNASVGVRWLRSYANEEKTRTYCIYEGPSEAAVRAAAKLNSLPVDRITEVPLDLNPGKAVPADASAANVHRYVVQRTFAPGALDGLDDAAKERVNANNARFAVRWVTSYASADKTRTYCIYEGPSADAVRKAASANDIPVDSISEIPVTLLPQ